LKIVKGSCSSRRSWELQWFRGLWHFASQRATLQITDTHPRANFEKKKADQND